MEDLSKKQKEVIRLLEKQRIRDVKDLESYKLSVCHPSSAGIDLGSKELYLALSPDIAAEMDLPIVHRFSTFTKDLLACKDLLVYCGIKTVSMESTSFYWTTIFSILQEAGIEVCLVNPKKFRMVPGRKTGIADCQWLQTLHLYGLLRGSFHPSQEIDVLRTYMRERDSIIKERSTFVQRMQKALTKMNLLLHNVIKKYPSAKHFASFLGFVPHNKITGGRVISARTDRIKNSAAQAFRKLIPSISQTKTALGAFYRRLAPRIGKAQAITATCRKLAVLLYNTLAFGTQYTEQGEILYKQKQEDWERKKLAALAKKYGCNIIPVNSNSSE